MPFKRYVEIGRLALINFGEDYGKLVVISDVLDQNRRVVLHISLSARQSRAAHGEAASWRRLLSSDNTYAGLLSMLLI